MFDKSKPVDDPLQNNDSIFAGDLWMHRCLNRFDAKTVSVKYADSKERLQAAQNAMADAVFISAIDFARIKSGWQVIPDVCLASNGKAPLAILTYESDESDLSTIVYGRNEPTVQAALQIILREKYEVESRIFSKDEQTDAKACHLLIDAEALRYAHTSIRYIDIAEEWFDLTGLPLVLGFWIVHESNPALHASIFKTAHREIFKNLQAAFGDTGTEAFRDFVMDSICNKMIYDFDDSVKEGVAEFYNYAFMHGLIDYNPKFEFRE